MHLIVYIFPLKDFTLIFFFYPSIANLSGKTDLHCATKILHFPLSCGNLPIYVGFLIETFKYMCRWVGGRITEVLRIFIAIKRCNCLILICKKNCIKPVEPHLV